MRGWKKWQIQWESASYRRAGHGKVLYRDCDMLLIGILFDGSHIKLNLAIIDCNQCQWQGLRRDKSPIDTDFVYDVCQSSRA